MDVAFTPRAWRDFEFWLETDPIIASKIRELLKEISRNPFHGLGKPEALRYDMKGYWSRRINLEHRLIYKITGTKGIDQTCLVYECRFHYD